MRIFISWSQEPAKTVAAGLRDLLRDVLQSTQPFVSDVDIEPGARSLDDITEALVETKFGIVVVTPVNMDRPWLNFEAGAMAARVDRINVVPFLVGLDDKSIVQRSPLGQLGAQAVLATRQDTLRMLAAINSKLPPNDRMEVPRLERVFGKFWPDFQNILNELPQPDDNTKPPRINQGEALAELLRRVRGLEQQMHSIAPNLYALRSVVEHSLRQEQLFTPSKRGRSKRTFMLEQRLAAAVEAEIAAAERLHMVQNELQLAVDDGPAASNQARARLSHARAAHEAATMERVEAEERLAKVLAEQ